MFQIERITGIIRAVPAQLWLLALILALYSCADQNTSDVSELCNEKYPIAGTWTLDDISIDEAGYDSVSEESGSLEINCNGTYFESYSYLVDSVRVTMDNSGDWSEIGEDTIVYANRDITWNNTKLNKNIATFVTTDMDSTDNLSQETTRLTFTR